MSMIKRPYKPGEIFLALFTLVYLIIFSAFYLNIRNYEFLLYVVVVLFFLLLIGLTLKKTNFDYWVLGGLSLWGLLHMMGGGIRVGEGVLYGVKLLDLYNTGEFFILRFDQLVHLLGFAVATLLILQLLEKNYERKLGPKVFYFVAVLAGMGLGALNESIEFLAVVILPETGVGGYYNTSLDLVFNMLGALTAVGINGLRTRFKRL